MTTLSRATTTTTTTDDGTAPVAPDAGVVHGRVAGPVTSRRVLTAELLKLRTVRSTRWALAATFLLLVLIGAFSVVGLVVQDAPPGGVDPAGSDPTGGAVTGVGGAMYAAVAFGVLAVGGEYATGFFKVSLAAVPRRALLVWGKAAAVAGLTFVVSLVGTVVAFLVAKVVLAGQGVTISLTTPGVARAVVGGALYLAVVAVLGVGAAWLLRSVAGSVAAVLVVLTLLPGIGAMLPAEVADRVLPYLPSNAGTAVLQLTPSGQLPPWTGFALFCAYALLLLLLATRVVQRRDA